MAPEETQLLSLVIKRASEVVVFQVAAVAIIVAEGLATACTARGLNAGHQQVAASKVVVVHVAAVPVKIAEGRHAAVISAWRGRRLC